MTVVIPVVKSYKTLVIPTIPDWTPTITIESEIRAVLSKTNLPSIRIKLSFGGIFTSFTILLFRMYPVLFVFLR